MNTRNLIHALEFEYFCIVVDNPDWPMRLWDYLVLKGIEPDDIWNYVPYAGRAADEPEPDWM